MPPKGWTPDPSWPEPPPGWQLWIAEEESAGAEVSDDAPAVPRSNQQRTDCSDPIAARSVDYQVALLEAENAALRARIEGVIGTNANELILLDDERILQDVGIYRYHHPLENALAYRNRLDSLATHIVEMVKADEAIEKSNMFTFDGSLAKGRRMTSDLGKLMLRAYNAEADNVIRTLRVYRCPEAR
jgi:hypothetical protein